MKLQKLTRLTLAALMLGGACFLATGCKKKSDVEKAADAVEDATKNAADAVGNAAEDAADAVKDATN